MGVLKTCDLLKEVLVCILLNAVIAVGRSGSNGERNGAPSFYFISSCTCIF